MHALADDLTEDTIATIGQIDPEHFSVIGRTTVMSYKRTSKTLAEIGRQLDASYLIAFAARDFPAAIDFAREAILLDPEFWIGHFQLTQAFVQLDDYDHAFESLNRASRSSAGNSKALSLRGYMLARTNNTAEALDLLLTLETLAHERHIPPYATALIHAGLRHTELALEWLDRAFHAHDVHLAFLTVDPKWDPFRSDPRFVALLRRCGFTPIVRGL